MQKFENDETLSGRRIYQLELKSPKEHVAKRTKGLIHWMCIICDKKEDFLEELDHEYNFEIVETLTPILKGTVKEEILMWGKL